MGLNPVKVQKHPFFLEFQIRHDHIVSDIQWKKTSAGLPVLCQKADTKGDGVVRIPYMYFLPPYKYPALRMGTQAEYCF